MTANFGFGYDNDNGCGGYVYRNEDGYGTTEGKTTEIGMNITKSIASRGTMTTTTTTAKPWVGSRGMPRCRGWLTVGSVDAGLVV